jgi:hypothetical protein
MIFLGTTVLDFRDFILTIGFPWTRSKREAQIYLPRDSGPAMGMSKLERYLRVKPDLLHKAFDDPNLNHPETYLGFIKLLDMFKTWECAILRGHIFSPVALCDEGNYIKVDYGTDEEDLVFDMLRNCQLTLCVCSVMLVGDALGISTPGPLKSLLSFVEDFVREDGPYVKVKIMDWKPLKHCPPLALMQNYNVDHNGLIYFDMYKWSSVEVSILAENPFSKYPDLFAFTCFVTKNALSNLQSRAVYVPNTYS